MTLLFFYHLFGSWTKPRLQSPFLSWNPTFPSKSWPWGNICSLIKVVLHKHAIQNEVFFSFKVTLLSLWPDSSIYPYLMQKMLKFEYNSISLEINTYYFSGIMYQVKVSFLINESSVVWNRVSYTPKQKSYIQWSQILSKVTLKLKVIHFL